MKNNKMSAFIFTLIIGVSSFAESIASHSSASVADLIYDLTYDANHPVGSSFQVKYRDEPVRVRIVGNRKSLFHISTWSNCAGVALDTTIPIVFKDRTDNVIAADEALVKSGFFSTYSLLAIHGAGEWLFEIDHRGEFNGCSLNMNGRFVNAVSGEVVAGISQEIGMFVPAGATEIPVQFKLRELGLSSGFLSYGSMPFRTAFIAGTPTTAPAETNVTPCVLPLKTTGLEFVDRVGPHEVVYDAAETLSASGCRALSHFAMIVDNKMDRFALNLKTQPLAEDSFITLWLIAPPYGDESSAKPFRQVLAPLKEIVAMAGPVNSQDFDTAYFSFDLPSANTPVSVSGSFHFVYPINRKTSQDLPSFEFVLEGPNGFQKPIVPRENVPMARYDFHESSVFPRAGRYFVRWRSVNPAPLMRMSLSLRANIN